MGSNYGWKFRVLENLLLGRTRWMVNSLAMKEHLQRSLRLAEDRVHAIYNAVDASDRDRAADRRDVRRELDIPEETPLVVHVGRLTRAKNHEMLFRVADEVVRARPDVRFVCVGHGEREQELWVLLGQLKLRDRVRLLGLRHDVPRLLAAADVFCFTSRHEGFPNALAEAMAGGLPVVTTQFPGVNEVVGHGRTGVIVPLDDDRAMANVILELLSDPARARRLGLAARQWVQENLSWPDLLKRIDDLYQHVLPSARPEPLPGEKQAASC
jgi:glycosyltransferase involved in cell wall biosynthesis